MKYQIKKITGRFSSDELELRALPGRKDADGYEFKEGIVLTSRAGTMSFQFDMTRAQAIDLAAALVDFATEEEETTEGAAA